MKKFTVSVVVAAGLIAGLTTAGISRADTRATGSPGQRTAAAPVRQTPVPPVLQFTATTLDGQPFDGASLAGRPVVVWSWMAGCFICRAEAPLMAEVARKYGDRVTFVGVGGKATLEEMRQFAKDTGVDAFTELADTDGTLWQKLGFTR